ncbi:MAG: ABC-F family ATP-binding cassette domain-containing protein [Pseudobdellovibrionaceae bacterium]|uniref:ABC-F family ATP-binding cassette domain-containing protein n=1 Tax=Oligoflexus sp. TaxID=1971216 RepID=UPI0027BFA18A|nr:ABC-F family ATP-binding cassette domain-containing protein [Oligoflexus sp.]MDQ3234584.1 ABC-F family ATP-binding cassette domain-containing protein [Pseudobdellovibrionaceae bacterium]HYX39030.1 ABC-F family ATP-binding cassette domain-containing protein [Oligoflexus sp.]
MGVLIGCQNLAKSMSHKILFQDLNLAIEDGEKLGIIGPNGAGKSTFLKILKGLEVPDNGTIAARKGLRLAFITQEPQFSMQKTLDEVLTDAGEKEGLDHDTALIESHKLLSRLGFLDPMQTVGTLSGGWRKRLAIAEALVGNPDLVLFDEPTNHLDLRSVIWLEEFLKQASFAWVLVSHDRYFLDRTAERILEIHPAYPGRWHVEEGGYSDFIVKKEAYLYDLQVKEATLANKLRREEEWLVRQPKARGTKARYRVDEAMRMKGEMQDLKQRLNTTSANLDFQASGRKSKQLLQLKGVTKSYGDRVLFQDLDFVIAPRMTLGILGDNGTGKSTLLKIMGGIEPATDGTVQTIQNLEIVYFDQAKEQLQPDWTLKRALSEGHDAVVFRDRSIHVASWARRFQFKAEQLDTPVSFLSGGEKARVMISRLMQRKADVLLLDEPNNDLDIDTLEILEDSLEDFPGAIVLVSHDRYLLDRLCTHFLGLGTGGKITAFADYSQWERSLLDEGKAAKKDKATTGTKGKGAKAGKLSYNEQREYEKMEESIMHAEEALAVAQTEAEDPSIASQTQKLMAASAKLQKAQENMDRLYARWAELETKVKGG